MLVARVGPNDCQRCRWQTCPIDGPFAENPSVADFRVFQHNQPILPHSAVGTNRKMPTLRTFAGSTRSQNPQTPGRSTGVDADIRCGQCLSSRSSQALYCLMRPPGAFHLVKQRLVGQGTQRADYVIPRSIRLYHLIRNPATQPQLLQSPV